MATPEILDFDSLLRPISADSECGKNLRDDTTSTFHYIKNTRVLARKTEGQFPDVGADQDDQLFFRQALEQWKIIDKQARDLLVSQSKDLEITSYLIEALVRLHGMAGLRDGFKLASDLIERYWDNLYPLAEEKDDQPKAWPLAGLIGSSSGGALELAIGRVHLSESSERGGSQAICYQDVQNVQIQPGSLLAPQIKAKIEKATEETSAGFVLNLSQDITQCREQFQRLCLLLEEKAVVITFSSSYVEQAILNCAEVLRGMGKIDLQPVPPVVSPVGNHPPVVQPPDVGTGKLVSRESALEKLLEVASYFEHCEPHSPMSYQLKQVVRWGRMSLPELLGELISDEKARSDYCKLTGIRLDPK